MEEVIVKKPMSYYEEQLESKTCRWCSNKSLDPKKNKSVSLADQPIEHYDHDGGYNVEGFTEKQWLYVVCPKCDHQWSLNHLGIKR